MTRYFTLSVALVAWLITAATLLAAADPLSVIPDDALGFAIIRDIGEANERAQALTQKIQLPVPDLLTLAKQFTGVDAGLDEKGGIALAAFSTGDDADAELSFVCFVPVTDYQEFIGQLNPEDADAAITEIMISGMPRLTAKKGNFAVLGDPQQRTLFERVLATSKNVTSTVEPLKKWLDQQHAAAVVTPAGKKMLVAKIVALLDAANTGADQNPNGDDDADVGGLSQARLKEMMLLGKRVLLAADEQLTVMAAGIRIDKNTALHVGARLAFKPEGELAAWAKGVKLPSYPLLAGVPEDKFAIAYGGVAVPFSPDMAKLINQFTEMGLQQFGLDAEAGKKLEAALARQRATEVSAAGVLGLIQPGNSIYASAASVQTVKSSDEYLAATREMAAALASGAKNPKTEEPLYEVADIMVDDLKTIELTTNVGAVIDEANPAAEQARGMFSWMFGKDGKLKIYFAAADARHVVGAYSKENLKKVVAHVRSKAKGLEADEGIAKTNALLPKGSQWVAYLSPQGLLQWADTFIRNIGGGQMNIQLPQFAETEPIGLAARVSGSGLDAELVLPDSVVAGIGQFIGMAQQMFQGGNPLP